MPHSWVMAFDDELEAFRAYAKSFPTNCVLLVDTYDVKRGIDNAITVGLEMRERGSAFRASASIRAIWRGLRAMPARGSTRRV